MIKTSASNFRTIQKQEVNSAYNLLNRDQKKGIVSKYMMVKQSKGIKKEKLKQGLINDINNSIKSAKMSVDGSITTLEPSLTS